MRTGRSISSLLGWSAVLTALTVASAVAADWPQFRGPERAGTSGEVGVLQVGAGPSPTIIWKREIGVGYSAVSVVGDRLYTMDADDRNEFVFSADTATGGEVWRTAVGDFVQAELGDGGPRSTPTVVDGVVFTATSQARLLALDAVDGALLWDRDLTEFGPVPRFGYAVSPLVEDELVIVEVGDKNAAPGVVALDRRSGETRWSALQGPAGYSSVLATEIHGVRQFVLFRRAGQEVVALSGSGEVLWRFATPDALAAIVMPLFQPPDRIFVSTSDDAFGGHMLRVRKTGGDFSVEQLWSERLMRNHFNTSVLVGDHVYGFDNGTLRCLDAGTGERKWARRGFGKGSTIAADGMLFVLSDGGLLALAKATPDGYQEAARLQIMEGRAWTAPSLAGGSLYVRDFDELVRVDVAAGGTEEDTP